MIDFVFENGKVYVIESQKTFYDNICKEHELDKESKQFLLEYLYYYYDERSPYHRTSTSNRSSEIKRYQYTSMEDNKFNNLIKKTSKCLEAIKQVTMSQEERIYQELVKSIDEMLNLYATSKKTLEDLEEMPKRVKAMNDLLAMKDKLKASMQKDNNVNDKLRAGKSESFIEKMNNKNKK